MFSHQGMNPHSFQIPVMGTGFSVDTALRIAKYGISSVISLVDDVLIEQMRKYQTAKKRVSHMKKLQIKSKMLAPAVSPPI